MSQAGDFRRGRHVVYDLRAHIVLTPKYRKKVFTKSVSAVVKRSIEHDCDRHGVVLEEFNTDLDHAHLIISYPPKISLSTFVGLMKGHSAKAVRDKCAEEINDKLCGDHFWSPSYFIASTGGDPLEKVKAYIEDQGKPPRGQGNPQWVK